MAKKITKNEKTETNKDQKIEQLPIIKGWNGKTTHPFRNYLVQHLVEKSINFDTHYIAIDFEGITIKLDSSCFELYFEGEKDDEIIRYKKRGKDSAYEFISRLKDIRSIIRGTKDK